MSVATTNGGTGNVIDLSSRRPHDSGASNSHRLVRICPEYDGLCMLYDGAHVASGKLFAMRLLGWGLRADGDIVGLVPWLNDVVACELLGDPDAGEWQGYYNPMNETIFYDPPPHKALELEGAASYFGRVEQHGLPEQEIPDLIGTHAMLAHENDNTLVLTEVLSWRLTPDGAVQAMLIDDQQISSTPVLPGDRCLFPAQSHADFRYFFQHHIANQIKAEDPSALAAIAMLFENR